MSTELLLSIRKILNETRQDRTCRAFLSKRGNPALVPFLGSSTPVYFFLGTSAAGYDIADTPASAEDYIDWANGYFANPTSDKGSFQSYLPYAANHTGDYEAFGHAAAVAHIVPIVTQRSAEITLPLVKACWPRTKTLVQSLQPKIVLCHGSLAWKYLAGLEDDEAHFLDLPEHLRHSVADIYDKVEGEKIAFQTRWLGFPDDFKTWIVPLAHLGGASGGKDARKKGELAVARARRAQGSSGESGPVVSAGGTRIRVRRPS
jgi:hypothetical protein